MRFYGHATILRRLPRSAHGTRWRTTASLSSPYSLLIYQVRSTGYEQQVNTELRLRAIHTNSVAHSKDSARYLLGTWSYGVGGLTSYNIQQEGQHLKFDQEQVQGSLVHGGDWWNSSLSNSEGEAAGEIRLRHSFDSEGAFVESNFMPSGGEEWNETVVARAKDTSAEELPKAISHDYPLINLSGGELVQFKAVVRKQAPWYMSLFGITAATESVIDGVFGIYMGLDGDNCLVRPVTLHCYDPSLPPAEQLVFSVDSGPLTAWNGKTEVRIPSCDVVAGAPDIAWSPHTPFITAAARTLPGSTKQLSIEAEKIDGTFEIVPHVGSDYDERLALLLPSIEPHVGMSQLYASKFRLRADECIVPVLVASVIL